MALLLDVGLFVGSLCLVGLASGALSERLDQIGAHLGFSAGLLGLVTALAADSPEIASAVTALASGRGDLGLGVIFGSNIFNLAALLGLGALVSGRIWCSRETMVLNAGVALLVTALVAAQRLQGLSTLTTGLLIAGLMISYGVICALKPARVARLPIPAWAASWLQRAVSATEVDTEVEPRRVRRPSSGDLMAVVPLLVMIVLASVALVRSASSLGGRWGWPEAVTGALVIACLTGLPNVISCLALARQGRGAAVVSETFNSNSLNLIAGAYLPTLFIAAKALSPMGEMALVWLVAATALSVVLFLVRGSLRRLDGAVLVLVWGAFAAAIMLLSSGLL